MKKLLLLSSVIAFTCFGEVVITKTAESNLLGGGPGGY